MLRACFMVFGVATIFPFALTTVVNKDGIIKDLVAQVAKLESEFGAWKEAERENTKLELMSPTGGSTYIRWGRSSECGSADAKVIYKGHAAGPHYNQGGGGSNQLCLHDSPQWLSSVFIPVKENYVGTIYGVEFEMTRDTNVFSTRNNAGASLHNFPSPCVACHVPSRGAVVMIPARTQCPPGWTYEYRGYVVSEMSSLHHRGQYSCWDEAPESSTGGINQDQSGVYPTVIGCGSLPCSRYTGGRAMTCVVCTK